jgi:hypothetical protein
LKAFLGSFIYPDWNGVQAKKENIEFSSTFQRFFQDSPYCYQREFFSDLTKFMVESSWLIWKQVEYDIKIRKIF